MDNIVECVYNMDNGYVEVWFTDGNMLRIKCEEVEADVYKRQVDEVIRKFNRMRMEMDAYKNSVDRAENAKEMLDENVREYMGNVQEKVSAREKSRDGRGEKKMEFRR